MATIAVPSIDQPRNIEIQFSIEDRERYNTLPFYFAKFQVDDMRLNSVYAKMTRKRRWQPNEGPTMTAVKKARSPLIRQNAFPVGVQSEPLIDTYDVTEVAKRANVHRQNFQSPVFKFGPHFESFFADNIQPNVDNIITQIRMFREFFLRTRMFHKAPYIYLPDSVDRLYAAPSTEGAADGSVGKTTDWLQAMSTQVGDPGNLSLNTVYQTAQAMSTDIGALPFKPGGDIVNSNGLKDKYVLITSEEAYMQFNFDPFRLENRELSLDVVTDNFKGDIFGRVTCMTETHPLRMLNDGTFPAPETRIEESAGAPDLIGETVPNPAYVTAPWEIALMFGADSFESFEVGPPPKHFSSNTAPSKQKFNAMRWNGEVRMIDNMIIPDGSGGYATNEWGEYLKLIADVTIGAIAVRELNVVPILFKRIRGVENSIA